MLRVSLEDLRGLEGVDQNIHPLVLYDGVCGLCNRLVQFILKRDRRGIFLFASLQSGLAHSILKAHGEDPSSLDTFYVVVDFDPARSDGNSEQLLARSDAARFVLQQLGGIWRGLAWASLIAPRPVREWMYGAVARNRYRMFGRYDACPVPSAETRKRFLDL